MSLSPRAAHLPPSGRPQALLVSLVAHRELLWQLVHREVIGRYKGSFMGIAWSLITPLLMLSVYSVVFGQVFRSRWGQTSGGKTEEFAIVLFVGLIVHGLFTEVATNAPRLMIGHANFVKRVVFPLELLPIANLASAAFHALVSAVVLVAGALLVFGGIPLEAAWLPVVIAPYLVALMGLAFFLASLGVYVRDIGQTMNMVSSVMLFLSPVFYPISAVSGTMRTLLELNPLTLIIESARQCILWGQLPDLRALAIYAVASGAFAAAGFWWFQRTRRGFADVI
ncbi:MAG: ABC transporter permease [Lautropia sp.]